MNLHQYGRIFLKMLNFSICFIVICSRSTEAEDTNAKLLTTKRSYMDPTMNPCERFYSYSCDNWNNVPGSKYNNIERLNDMYSEQLEMILEGEEYKLETHEIFSKLRDFYVSCKEMTDFDATRYLEAIKPTDTDDWPRDGEPWNPQGKWNVWSTLGKLGAIGFGPLFYLNLANLQKHQKIDVIVRRIHSFDDELRYVDIFRKSRPQAHFRSKTPFLYRPVHIEMTIAELQQQNEHIDFVAYFSAFFGHDNVGNITLAIKDYDKFSKIAEVFQAATQDDLIHTIKKLFVRYMSTKAPKEEGEIRRISCIGTMSQLVPLALDYMYEHEVYSHDRMRTGALIEKVFKAMQHKLAEHIEENRNEFSTELVEGLKEKLNTMKLLFGNLPQGVDDHFYEKYFQNWEVQKNDIYGNHLRAVKRKNVEANELLKLQEFAPLLTYTPYSQTRNSSLYLYPSNTIVIPYHYLSFPVVHPELHELFVYAELGRRLAEEMTNALLNYDEEGQVSTFNVTDYPKFQDAMECIDQHTTTPEYSFGVLYVSTDIASFQLSYDTYFQQSQLSEFSGESEFDNTQLYFIRYAQTFCEAIGGYDRVANIVAHSREFKEAFSCPTKEAAKFCTLF